MLNARFLRFLIVGGLNTAIAYGIYALVIFIGWGYFFAATISFVIGIVISFKTHGRYVFNSRGNHAFPLYVMSWLFLYLVNIGMLALLTGMGVDSYLAGALLLPAMAVLSFLVFRFVVFREVASKLLDR